MDAKVRFAGGSGRGVAVAFLVTVLAHGVSSPTAEAQNFGYGNGFGYGSGYGFGGLYYRSPSVDYINEHALVTARAGAVDRPQNLTAPRDAYEMAVDSGSKMRYDAGLTDRYDISTRRDVQDRSRVSESVKGPVPARAPARRIVPLSTFFENSPPRLVWPANAPADGDLEQKRAVADRAVLAVLAETNRSGSASLTVATEARSKLLEYGRPALAEIRGRSTLRVADSFHQFLLSLYDSIGQAATSSRTPHRK